MVTKKSQTNAEKARKALSGNTSDDVSSGDELGLHQNDWEWIYEVAADGRQQDQGEQPQQSARRRRLSAKMQNSKPGKIVGVKLGHFECRLGDPVVLRAGRNETWVAIIQEFIDDAAEDDKMARFMWFSTPSEIRNKSKRRTDALENELYITAQFDENSLDTIKDHAIVLSSVDFLARYPHGRVPRSSKDHGRVFVCRRGCNSRTATYTDEFAWSDVYGGVDDLENLRLRVERGTKATRKRGEAATARREKDLEDFVTNDGDTDGDINTPRTPSKRQKLDPARTPGSRKRDTPRKFTTPTHRRILTKRPLEFTPLATRTLSLSHVLSSPFQLARSQLHVSAVPASLPCREAEFSSVYTHLESAISAGTGTCIYISGTPGTGKTATVHDVVSALHGAVAADELDDFIFVEINGMKVAEPQGAYALLWEALAGDRVSPAQALGLLEREFSRPSPRRVPCVVLMDELDQLVTRSQSVMYNFFNWPNLRHSRLIVLAVANTMDLPERTLSNKISSRLGLTRITFPGYTHEQLIKIIQSRLAGVSGTIVTPDAVQFASRKVAQVSGDARRALDICRRAVEIAEAEAAAAAAAAQSLPLEEEQPPATPGKPDGTQPKATSVAGETRRDGSAGGGQVTIQTVQRAIREATTSPLQQYLRGLPLACKLLLAAVLAQSRRTGVGECLLGAALDEARRLASLCEVGALLLCGAGASGGDARGAASATVRPSRLLAMGVAAAQLSEAGILLVESRRGERAGKVRLSVGDEEIRLAYRDDGEVHGLGFA